MQDISPPFLREIPDKIFFKGRKQKKKRRKKKLSLLILIHASVTGKAGSEYELLVFVTFGKIPRIKKKKKRNSEEV